MVDQVKESEYYGKTLATWSFSEYQKHQRGFIWFAVVGIVSIGLITWTVVRSNFLFLGIILIILLVIFITSRREPDIIELKIYETGLAIGSKYYPYKNIKKFWVAYEPPLVKKLYLDVEGITRPLISIPLEDQNPLKIRDILIEYVEEDLENDGETASDAWERVLKL